MPTVFIENTARKRIQKEKKVWNKIHYCGIEMGKPQKKLFKFEQLFL